MIMELQIFGTGVVPKLVIEKESSTGLPGNSTL